jgi:hypothetical protein
MIAVCRWFCTYIRVERILLSGTLALREWESALCGGDCGGAVKSDRHMVGQGCVLRTSAA